MRTELDRAALRERLKLLSDVQRRIVLERAVEHLPDSTLDALLDGLVRMDERRAEGLASPSLRERVESHAAATRRGDFRGEYLLRNCHGQREPWQTAAWIAATAHLFDLVLERVRAGADVVAPGCLRSLVELVEEVDDRTDELVVFEDSSAAEEVASDLAAARRLAEGARREIP